MDVAADKLIDQIYMHLGSIRAGNNSLKLRHQVISLLDSLVEEKIIKKSDKQKNIHNGRFYAC